MSFGGILPWLYLGLDVVEDLAIRKLGQKMDEAHPEVAEGAPSAGPQLPVIDPDELADEMENQFSEREDDYLEYLERNGCRRCGRHQCECDGGE